MNQINQSAVRTIPSHAGICRRMTPHMNTPCKFLAAQKKGSSCHIRNMATWSTLPRVLPASFLPYAPSQGSSPANRGAEQQNNPERFLSAEPAGTAFPGNAARQSQSPPARHPASGASACWHTAALGITGSDPVSRRVCAWLAQLGELKKLGSIVWAHFLPLVQPYQE